MLACARNQRVARATACDCVGSRSSEEDETIR
jgi:hypothetical protein